MTQKEQKELIRQEIDRRIGSVNEKQDTNPAMPKYRWHMYEGMKEAFIDMKYFIDSLPEEKPSEDLNDEIKKFIEEYGYERGEDKLLIAIVARHFAEWMRKKDVEDMYMSDNRHFLKCYEQGKVDMKVQMMKDAVEGEIVKDITNKLAVTAKNINLDGFKFGDKVRIIIVKED